MSFFQLLAFAVASLVLLAIPGPTIILVVSKSLSHGTKHTLALLAGIGLGDFVTMTASLLGLGAILATSALIFGFLKIAGAAYLIYLGIRMWRDAPRYLQTFRDTETSNDRKTFLTAFTVTALNPKSIVFFIAFVPQFIVAGYDVHRQMVAFIAIFVAISLSVSAAYAILAALLRAKIKIASMQYYANRTGGGVLAVSGLASIVLDGIHG